MGTLQTKIIGAGFLFLLIYLSGNWLSRAGKPYASGIVTVHKFISFAEVALLYLVIRQYQQTATLTTSEQTTAFVTAGLFVITIISGGLLSTNKPMPAILLLVHKAAPYLTLVSTGVALNLLLTHPAG